MATALPYIFLEELISSQGCTPKDENLTDY
jgi:hypothetical protein